MARSSAWVMASMVALASALGCAFPTSVRAQAEAAGVEIELDAVDAFLATIDFPGR